MERRILRFPTRCQWSCAVTNYTQVPCPNCQRSLRVRREYSGKVIACKYCEHAFHPKLPVECPHCHENLLVRIGYLGQRITCKHCDQSFRAPRPEDAEYVASGDSAESMAALQKARLEVAALEEQAERLRRDIDTRTSEQAQALKRIQEQAEEVAALRTQVTTLQGQLDQARIDLQQASSLRGELDEALRGSQELETRTRQLNAQTQENVRLRDLLQAHQTETQQHLQTAREAATGLQRELDSIRAARAQSELEREALGSTAEELRGQVEALQQSIDHLREEHDQQTARERRENTEIQESLSQEITRLRQAGEETRRERDALVQQGGVWEASQAEWFAHERSARAEIDRLTEELASLRHESDAARQEAASLREAAANTAEAQAHLNAGRQEWQEQLDAVCRRHEEERTALRADLERVQELSAAEAARAKTLTRERDDMAAQMESLLAFRHDLVEQVEAARSEAARLRHEQERTLADAETARKQIAETVALDEDRERQRQQSLGQLQNLLHEVRHQHAEETRQRVEVTRKLLHAQAELSTQRERTATLAREVELACEELVKEREAGLTRLTEEQQRAATERQSWETQREAARRRAEQEVSLGRRETERLRQEVETARSERDRLGVRVAEADAAWAQLASELQSARSELETLRRSQEEHALQAAAQDEWQKERETLCDTFDQEREEWQADRERLQAENDVQMRQEREKATLKLRELEGVAQKREAELESRQRKIALLHEELSAAQRQGKNEAAMEEREREHAQALAQVQEERDLARSESAALARSLAELRGEHDRLSAELGTNISRRAEADVMQKYLDLEAKFQSVVEQMTQQRETVSASTEKKATKSRLWSRGSGSEEDVSGANSLERRLDSLKVEAAVERERSLRMIAEAARVDLERQLAAALALPRAKTEPNGKGNLPPTEEVIPLPYQPPRPPKSPPSEPPSPRTPGMPRRLEDLF